MAPSFLLVVLTVTTGCGEDGGSSGAEEPTTPASSSSDSSAPADAPGCGEVWSTGATLPRGYRGCTDEDGSYVERDALGCSSGQRMVTYADRYYGVLGGTVRESDGSLEDDHDYRQAVRSCRA